MHPALAARSLSEWTTRQVPRPVTPGWGTKFREATGWVEYDRRVRKEYSAFSWIAFKALLVLRVIRTLSRLSVIQQMSI